MSFGIRNVENRTKALLEMRRVLTEREGMTNTDHSLYIMEFVRPTEGALAPLASIFIEYIIPSLGKFVLSLSKLDPTQNPIQGTRTKHFTIDHSVTTSEYQVFCHYFKEIYVFIVKSMAQYTI